MQQLNVSEENSYTIGWKAVKKPQHLIPLLLGGWGWDWSKLPWLGGSRGEQRNRSSAGGTAWGNGGNEVSGPGLGGRHGITSHQAGKGQRKREGKEEKTSVTPFAVTGKELSPPPRRQHPVEHHATDDHLLFSYRFICWHLMAVGFLLFFFSFLSFGFITLCEKPSMNSK